MTKKKGTSKKQTNKHIKEEILLHYEAVIFQICFRRFQISNKEKHLSSQDLQNLKTRHKHDIYIVSIQ